jgi:hypothetical protein
MIFYRKNLITNTALSNVKRYFLLLVFIFSVIQIFISNFNYIDLLIILMILSSTFFMMLTIFNIKYITEYFIPFIIVFSFNIFSISGALIFKTIFLQNLSSNLFLPLKTFATLSSYQVILVLTLVFFASSLKLKNISSFISDKVIFKLNGYVIPSIKYLYFILIFFFINKFYLDLIDQGSNKFSDYGDVFMKILYGINILHYLPLIIFFYLFQTKKISKNNLYFIIFLYIFSGFFFGIASNTRTKIFIFFPLLLFCIIFFRIFIAKFYLKIVNFLLIIIIFVGIFNSKKISDIVVQDRKYKSEFSAMELFGKSTGERSIDNKIISKMNDESYVNNPIIDRIVVIKYLDKSLYLSQNFNKNQKEGFIDFAKMRALSILPQPIIHLFNKDYDKKDYNIANGSLIDRVNYGRDIGGLKNAGHYLVEVFIFFNSYLLSGFIVFFLFLTLFTIFQSLQKNNQDSLVFSPLLIVYILRLSGVANSDNLTGFVTLFLRDVFEGAFIYFIIILIYLKFFSTN